MIRNKKIILFELNEVPYRVMETYAQRSPTSAMAALLARGQRYSTMAEDEGHLSPWITWPTLHRGVNNSRHQLYHLGQDTSETDTAYPPLWHLLTAAKLRVGVFGSLHTYPLPADVENYPFYVPDPFAQGPEAHPHTLSEFQRFSLAMTDLSARNVSRNIPFGQALAFMRAAPKLGLKASTVARIGRMVAKEQIFPSQVVRRRTAQSMLSFDFFEKAVRDTLPDCAFYFTNHVASSLHRYWPALFPQDYSRRWWSDEWERTFSNEIIFAMSEADRMLGRLMSFVHRRREYAVVVAGSMGQAAVDGDSQKIERQLLLKNPEKLMQALGIRSWERKRTMEPAYTFSMSDADADKAFHMLRTVNLAGKPISLERPDAETIAVQFGQPNLLDSDITATIGNRIVTHEELGLANVRIQDEVGSAAYHVPEGAMIVYDPEASAQTSETKISTTQVAPAILRNFGIAPPSHMME